MITAFYAVAFVRRPLRLLQFVTAQIAGREATCLDQMVRTKRTATRPARRVRRRRRRPRAAETAPAGAAG